MLVYTYLLIYVVGGLFFWNLHINSRVLCQVVCKKISTSEYSLHLWFYLSLGWGSRGGAFFTIKVWRDVSLLFCYSCYFDMYVQSTLDVNDYHFIGLQEPTGVNVMKKESNFIWLHDYILVFPLLWFDSWMKTDSEFSATHYKMYIILHLVAKKSWLF